MIAEILQKVLEYRKKAGEYLLNYYKEIDQGNREKAGESLWEAFSCLVNAMYLLSKGKPVTRHDEMIRFAQYFLLSVIKEGKEYARIVKDVQKLHSNFYHFFLDDEEFNELCAKTLKLIEILRKYL